jgi:hypothetical protein
MSQRDQTAATARQDASAIPTVYSSIDKLSSTADVTNNSTLASSNALDLQNDIVMLQAKINDSLIMGDSMFSQAGYGTISTDIQARHDELKKTKDGLEKDIRAKERLIHRSNRDFTDVNHVLEEEPKKNKFLTFIEDYTILFLVISYLFMMTICAMFYVQQSAEFYSGLGKAAIASGIITMIATILLYYIA